MSKLAKDAFYEAHVELMLAKDFVNNAVHSRWKWRLILALSESLIKSVWAIYFLLKEQNEEIRN